MAYSKPRFGFNPAINTGHFLNSPNCTFPAELRPENSQLSLIFQVEAQDLLSRGCRFIFRRVPVATLSLPPAM